MRRSILLESRFVALSIFGLCYLVLLLGVWGQFLPWDQALIRVALNGAFHVTLVGVLLFVFIPRLFRQYRWGLFWLCTVGLLLLLLPLQEYLDRPFVDGNPNFPAMSRQGHFLMLFLGDAVVMCMTALILILQDWYRDQAIQHELREARLEAEHRFLKAQVNPHFLFNTLNNLYTLALLGSDKTAPSLLRLSGMMRYMLHEGNQPSVPLEKEVAYLRDYIDLQQLKKQEPQQIAFEVSGDVKAVTLPPLLFIPFFENAVKHGHLDNTAEGWLNARLDVEGPVLHFEIANNFLPGRRKDTHSGIGLENVRQRLDRLFPGRYQLDIQSENGIFRVNLQIRWTP